MAKKIKKPIRKPKKKSGSKKKPKSNIFTILIVAIFILILAFFLIFRAFRPSEKKFKEEKTVSQLIENISKTEETKSAEKVEKNEVLPPKKEKTEKNSEKIEKKQEKKAAETRVVEKSIAGTWMSTTGGAVLTMKNNEYRLDFMGIDSDQAIIGTYSVDGSSITFVNKKDPCKDAKGLYEVSFNKQEIGFKCKSDECTKRKATLPTAWEWLDTEE